ncbi:MAG: hypothetical protein NVS3B20_07150 [Polyangiales bacterium]
MTFAQPIFSSIRSRSALLCALAATLQFAACSAKKGEGGGRIDELPPGGMHDDGGFDVSVGGLDALGEIGTGPCSGLKCQVQSCGGSAKTSISGTVYAPNGTLPLYNVIVYVPNGELKPLSTGVTCDKCGTIASGDPITTALSDYTGHFKLDDVPVGNDIPLVVQLGKWRRKVVIPTVKACVDNPLTDPNLSRLPKNQKEGNMPKIAVTTGGCDQLSCMLPKVGIDAAEFGPVGGTQAVTFYAGSVGSTVSVGSMPLATTPAQSLWGNLEELKKYDMAIFSCECSEEPTTKDSTAYQAVTDYLGQGGRIFTTDYQYTWYKYSPDPALQSMGMLPTGVHSAKTPVNIDTSFPKGKALADWLKVVDPASSYGKVKVTNAFDNFHSVDKTKATVWASSLNKSTPASDNPRFITVNTPVGKPAENQCGKGVHLDAHINSFDVIDDTFPKGCSSKLGAGEEAFAFFFFDLASCIQKEGEPPKPPTPVK